MRKPKSRCTVCAHPERAAIDKALLGMVGEISDRAIARQYGVPRAALARHRATDIKRAVEKAAKRVEKAEIQAGASSLEQAETLVLRAMEILSVAEVRDGEGRLTRATDVKAAMAALGGAAKAIGLQAQLRGEIKTGSTTNVLVDQRGRPTEEWAELTGVLFAALRPWPEASRAAAAALAGAASGAPALASSNRSAPDRTALDVVEGEIV